MAEIKFDIVKTLGVLSESTKGWQKEINLVRWNERDPKFDIREWGPNHERMSKGITLSREEMVKLKEILSVTDLEKMEQT